MELIDPGTSSKGGSFEQFETRARIILLSFEKPDSDGELGALLKSSWDPPNVNMEPSGKGQMGTFR